MDIWIVRAEETWLELLHSHAEEVFKRTFLPSHDHTHHQRVWNICREVLKEIADINSSMDDTLVEGVLVAAFFHDVGMVRSMDAEHGKLGSDLCRAYFRDRKLKPPARFEEVLESIELHDVKDERVYRGIYPGEPQDILSILSIADDLEALGTIGIYRYAEIYLQRWISLEQLGNSVIGNVTRRFNNISKHGKACSGVVERYRQQYEELILFYEKYNQQLLLEQEPRQVLSGPIGVVNHIRTMSVEGKITPQNFHAEMKKSSNNNFVNNYFRKLKDELELARN